MSVVCYSVRLENVSGVYGAARSGKSSELSTEVIQTHCSRCDAGCPLSWSQLSLGEMATCLLGLQLPLSMPPAPAARRRCRGHSYLHLPSAYPCGGCPGEMPPGPSFPFSTLAPTKQCSSPGASHPPGNSRAWEGEQHWLGREQRHSQGRMWESDC